MDDQDIFPNKLNPIKLEITSSRGGRVSSIREGIILKVLVIGDPCVGKTSYVQRLVSGTFHKNYKGTIGVDFAMKVLNWNDNTVVKVQLWDIAGQERYTSMTRVYYRDAKACIIMFDATSRSSFLNVIKWKRDFDSKVSDPNNTVPCILLANKCDCTSQRQVHAEEIEKVSSEFNFCAWAEISVKNNFMVDETLTYLVNTILQFNLISYSNNKSSQHSMIINPVKDSNLIHLAPQFGENRSAACFSGSKCRT